MSSNFFCHQNLNSITIRSFWKISLLFVYNAIHKFDVIFVYETDFDTSIFSNDKNVSIPAYILTKAGHPGNGRSGRFVLTIKVQWYWEFLVSPF